MATTIGALTYNIGADVTKFTKGMKLTKQELTATKRVWKESLTPVDKYNRALNNLNALQAKGAVTGDRYQRTLKKIKAEYAATKPPRFAGLKAIATAMTGVVTAGAAAVTAIVGSATAGLREMQAVAEGIGAKQMESFMSMAVLAQQTTTPGGFKKLAEAARQTFAEGGARTEAEAATQIFKLASVGQLKNRELFSRMGQAGLVSDPGELAKAAQTIIVSMGAKEVGTMPQVIAKALAASALSGATDVETILPAAAKSGAMARTLGLTDEEVFAATAMMANASGSAEQGGTQVAGLVASMMKKDVFKGLSIEDAVLKIKEMDLSGADLFKLLGRKEAVLAAQKHAG